MTTGWRWLRACSMALVCLAGLNSCGGGGGGGGGGAFSVSFDTTTINFDLQEDAFPGVRTVTATAHGTPPASGIYVGGLVTGQGITQPIYVAVDEEAGQAYAYIQPMQGLAPGNYAGTIQLFACADPDCHSHFGGSPHAIAYTITVHPRLKAAPTSVAFVVPEKQAGTAQTLQVQLPEGSEAAQAMVTFNGGPGPWLQLQNNGTSLQLVPQAATLPVGTYYATVLLGASNSQQTVSVPVSLTVTYDPNQHLRVDKTSLTLAAPEGQVLPAQTITVGLPPGSTTYTATDSYGAGGWLQLQQNGAALVVTASTVGRAPGTHATSIIVSDATSGESVVIPVSLKVSYDALQHLRVDQGSLAFAGVESQVLAGKTLHFGLPPSASALTTTITYGAGGSGWLQVQQSGSDLIVNASMAGLAPATYSANLTLGATGSTETLVVPVSMTVSKGLIPLANESIVFDMAALGTGQFAVQAVAGVVTTQWSATSNKPWLVLDSATGAIGGNLQWHLDPALFGGLANNASHTATITVSGSGLSAVTRQITFSKQLKEVVHVDSLALLAGESGEVLLYGDGFASLADFAGSLQVSGGLVPQSVTVLSDHLASITLQNVPAGDYTISLPAALSGVTHSPVLHVYTPRSYPYQAVATTGRKGSLVWDAVSQSAFAVDLEVDRIHRFGWTGSAFDHATATTGTPIALGLDRDHGAVLVSTLVGDLQRFLPATLEAQASLSLGGSMLRVTSMPLVITGDNRLWAARTQPYMGSWGQFQEYRIDAGAGQFLTSNQFTFYNGPWGLAAPNGQRMLMTQSSGISPAKPLLWLDVATNLVKVFTEGTQPDWFTWAATDRKGTRWLLNPRKLYDYSLNVLGNITPPDGWTFVHGVISRDGSRLYMLGYDNTAVLTGYSNYAEPTNAIKPRIFVLDISALPADSTSYPIVGYFDFDDYPGCRKAAVCDTNGSSVLADDGRTIFLMGDRKFIAIPVPAEYVPAATPPAAPAAPMGVLQVSAPAAARPRDLFLWRVRGDAAPPRP